MHSRSKRVLAAVGLLCLLVGQVHLLADLGGGAPSPSRAQNGHRCLACAAGAWAVLSAPSGPAVGLCVSRLEVEQFCVANRQHLADDHSPRAPPLV